MRKQAIWLVGLGWLLATPCFAKIILLQDRAHARRVPGMAEVLHQVGIKLVDPSLHPTIARLQKELLALTEQVENQKEKPLTTYLAISRSAAVNAGFLDLGQGRRLVVVNMGLIHYLEDDSEAVFVIGHEFEHGWSSIDEYRQKYSQGSLLYSMLQRPVENEVDGKSVFLRMLPIGADPYASGRFMRRMRSDFGAADDESLSRTHTGFGSREDTNALSITIARRELGQDIDWNKVPALASKLTQTIRDFEFTQAKYLEVLYPELEREFALVAPYISRFFALHAEDHSNQQRTRPPIELPREAYDLLTFEQWDWQRAALSQLPHSMPVDDYQRLRKAHIKTVGEIWAKTAAHYAGRKADPRQIQRLLSAMNLPRQENTIAQLQESVDRTQESITEFEKLVQKPDKDVESNLAYLAELRERLEREKQQVEMARDILPAWQEQSNTLRASKALFLTNHKEYCDTEHGVTALPILELEGTPQADQLWDLASHYAQNFNGGYLEGSRSFNDHLLWRRLYEIDPNRATKTWESFLRVSAARLVEANSFYSASAFNFPILIRQELGGFAQYPLYAEAYCRILKPAALRYLEARRAEKLATDIWSGEHPHYAVNGVIDQLLQTITHAKNYANAGVLEPSDIQKMEAQLFPDVETLLNNAVATITEKHRPQWTQSASTMHQALALRLAEPLRSQTLARLRPGVTLGQIVVELSHAIDSKVVRHAVRDSGIHGFYPLLREMDPKTPAQTEQFFETLYRLSKVGATSRYRPKEPELPFLDPQAEIYAGYVKWLMNHHPQERATILEWFKYPAVDQSYSYSNSLTPDQVVKLQGAYDAFFKQCSNVKPVTLSKLRDEFIRREIIEKMGPQRDVRLGAQFLAEEFSDTLRPRVKTYLDFFEADRPLALRVFAESARYAMDSDDFSERLIALMEEELGKPNLSEEAVVNLAHAYAAIAEETEVKNLNRDRVFGLVWDRAPESARELLSTPTTVASLLTHQQKRRAVMWRIETEIQPAAVPPAQDLRSVRPGVEKAKQLLERLLPEVSDLRDELVDEIGADLVTNPAETDLLYSLCTNTDNWFENNGLAILDLPEHFQKLFSNNKEKMGFVRFLTGQTTAEQLQQLLGSRMGMPSEMVLLGLKGMEVRFRESNALIRTYVLLAFLDDLKGLLADPQSTEEIYTLLLGEYARNKIVRATMSAYFESIHPTEKRVLIARVLAGMIDNPNSSKGFVRRIVDGLKTLGYKGAQFMLAAGMVPPEMEDEFAGVFDRAIKPRRDRALARIRAAFGQDLPGVRYFGGLLGYGSVNFVLGLDFDDQGQVVEAAFRGQHENVVGQIRNEAQVWTRAIPLLEANGDSDIRLVGNYLRDALDAAMETLKEGGSEVDLASDRDQIRQATPLYRRAPEQTRSGYAIEVVPVLENIQMRVLPAMSSQASIHPRIQVQSIPAHEQALPLAQDALGVEMTAAYEYGIFDLDGHPGNWLVEDRTRTLWRTDVSQLRSATELTADQRSISRVLLKPFLNSADRRTLVALASSIFRHSGVEIEKLRSEFMKLLQAHGTPESNPIANLYFYRRKLQQTLGGEIRFTREMVWYIQTVARNRTHIDTIGRWRFYRALNDAAGGSRVSSAVGFALHGVKNCATHLLGWKK
jgi:hypothetical protein